MVEPTRTSHLDDSDLLRVLDGDASAHELELLHEHLRACGACASRLALLRQRTTRFSALVGEIELPPDFAYPAMAASTSRPASQRHSWLPEAGWLRAAAVIVLLLVPVFAIQPLRAAVVGWMTERWTELTAVTEGPSHVEIPAHGAPESGSTIWFEPEASELLLQVDSWQRSGTLLIRSVVGREGSISILGGSGDEMPVVSGRALRIRNTVRSTANYEIGLPAGVSGLRIMIDGAAPMLLRPDDTAAGKLIPLQQSVFPE